MFYANSRRRDLPVSLAVKYSRNSNQILWLIPALAMLSSSCSAQQMPARPYDKLCEAQVGLQGNAVTYAYTHPGTGLKEIPDLISGLPKDEQALARTACDDWGKNLMEQSTGLQICKRSGGKSLNCKPAN